MYHANVTKHRMHFWRISWTPEGKGTYVKNRTLPPCLSPSQQTQFFRRKSQSFYSPRPLSTSKLQQALLVGLRCFGLSKNRFRLWVTSSVNLRRAVIWCLIFFWAAELQRPCLMEPWHRIFTDCDSDSECVGKIVPSLLHDHAEQVINSEQDITEGKKVQNGLKHYLAE